MKTVENHDPHRDSPAIFKKLSFQALEELHEFKPVTRIFKFNCDLFFHIAAKGTRSKGLV